MEADSRVHRPHRFGDCHVEIAHGTMVPRFHPVCTQSWMAGIFALRIGLYCGHGADVSRHSFDRRQRVPVRAGLGDYPGFTR